MLLQSSLRIASCRQAAQYGAARSTAQRTSHIVATTRRPLSILTRPATVKPTTGTTTTTSRTRTTLPYATLLAALIGFAGASQLPSAAVELEAPVTASMPNDPSDVAFRLDSATAQPFPVVLPPLQTVLPPGCSVLKLVGLGVRTVSFLRVRVYVAGLYVDEATLQTLSSVPGWKGFQADWMQGKPTNEHSSEALVSALLDHGVTCAIRIIPVRPTDYHHLRDGFTRAIQGRAKLARKADKLSAEDDEALSVSLQRLKEAFPKASLPKGKALDLLFTPAANGGGMTLTLEEEGKVLGHVQPPPASAGQYTVARQLLLAYLANKDEISAPFKQSVAQGFEEVVRS